MIERLDRFLTWVEQHYRDGKGAHTTSIDNARQIVRRLREGYAYMNVVDFGPRALSS